MNVEDLIGIECGACSNTFFVEDLGVTEVMPANCCPFCGVEFTCLLEEE